MSAKPWLSLDEQIALLQRRRLTVDDSSSCRRVLQRVGYYHLSGYGRYFQVDPAYGDNNFRPGTRFEDIAVLQDLDSRLRTLCLAALAEVELTLRTGFAYRFAERNREAGALWNPSSYTTAGSATTPVHELVLCDLNQSKQHFIKRHRAAIDDYPDLPAWVAVEALSFGSLSRAIEHCADVDVRKALANDLKVAQQGFSSQIHAFVNLRNACAHNSRLWNDIARIQASVPNNVLGRAKRRVGRFSSSSNYQVVVALAQFVTDATKSEAFVTAVNELLETSAVFRDGMLNPKPYPQR